MAEIVRYVNTASSGGDGTTNATSGANAAYASLNSWEAAEQTNLVSAGDTHIVYCAGSAADSTAAAIVGWTTDATRYISIIVPTAERHLGLWNTSKYRLEVAGANALSIQEDFVRINGLQLATSGTTAVSELAYFFVSATSDNIAENIIIKGNGIYSEGLAVSSSSTGNLTVINSFIYGATRTFFGGIRYGGTGTLKVYNCTLVKNYYGIRADSGTVIARNVLAKGNTNTNYIGTFDATSSNCASDTATVPGAGSNHQASKTFTFVSETAGSEDYHLTSSDTGATDLGADLSSIFTTDIDGDTRTGSWDIGADEYVAAGGGSTYEEAVTYAASLGISKNTALGAAASLSFGFNADANATCGLTAAAALSLNTTLGLTSGGALIAGAAITLATNLGISTTNVLTLEEALALGLALSFDTGLGNTFNETVSFGLGLNCTPANTLTAEAVLNMATSLGVSTVGQLDAVTSLVLALNAGQQQDTAGSVYSVETTLGILVAASMALDAVVSPKGATKVVLNTVKNKPVHVVVVSPTTKIVQ